MICGQHVYDSLIVQLLIYDKATLTYIVNS